MPAAKYTFVAIYKDLARPALTATYRTLDTRFLRTHVLYSTVFQHAMLWSKGEDERIFEARLNELQNNTFVLLGQLVIEVK